jgi:hypothetical protein
MPTLSVKNSIDVSGTTFVGGEDILAKLNALLAQANTLMDQAPDPISGTLADGYIRDGTVLFYNQPLETYTLDSLKLTPVLFETLTDFQGMFEVPTHITSESGYLIGILEESGYDISTGDPFTGILKSLPIEVGVAKQHNINAITTIVAEVANSEGNLDPVGIENSKSTVATSLGIDPDKIGDDFIETGDSDMGKAAQIIQVLQKVVSSATGASSEDASAGLADLIKTSTVEIDLSDATAIDDVITNTMSKDTNLVMSEADKAAVTQTISTAATIITTIDSNASTEDTFKELARVTKAVETISNDMKTAKEAGVAMTVVDVTTAVESIPDEDLGTFVKASVSASIDYVNTGYHLFHQPQVLKLSSNQSNVVFSLSDTAIVTKRTVKTTNHTTNNPDTITIVLSGTANATMTT